MAENPMRPKMKAPRPSLLQFILPYIIILGLIIFLIFGLNGFAQANVKDFTFVSLINTLETINPNDVVQIIVAQRETVIDISGSILENGVTYTFSEIVPNFYEGNIFTALERFDNKVIINNAFQQSILNQILIYILPLALILAVGLFVMSRMGGGNANNRAFEFGKSPVKNIQNSKVRFADVAGCDEEKAEMVELVDYLKNPKKFSAMGARIPKGVILKGPPGTGKTLLAKAVAGEANVPFFSISGSDFVEMFVGVGASRVRDMFKKAMQNAPSILFIDEIDAVGRQRGAGLGGGHDEREQTLNQLLVEMDGFADNSGIIVIAATNRPDVLDPALLRPGRFDRAITVNLPDKKGREAILKVHSKNKKLHADVDFAQIASRTPGFSGADLENVLNEAAILAVRLNQDKIQLKDVDEAIDRVMGGPAKTTKVITPREKELIAYHETGHAIVGLKLANALKVQKVTIIPRGDAGGYVLMTPTDDRFLNTKGELLDRITGLLAGRMSEEVFFDDVTTGAHNDIEQATKITRMMVTELGMSSLGPIQFERQSGSVFLGRDYTSAQRNVSSEIAYAIDKEISKIIHDAMAKAKKIILDNRKEVELIAKTLLEKETLTNEEVVSLVSFGKLPQPGMKIEEQFIENGPKKRVAASVNKPTKVLKEKVSKTKSK